jgi:Holliday junction resolvase
MESKIQAKIKARFENAGWIVVKLIQTNCNGIPDLMCLKGGKTVFVEVKQPGKKPTELQQFRYERTIYYHHKRQTAIHSASLQM